MKSSRVSKKSRNAAPAGDAERLVLSAYLHSTKNAAFREFVRRALNSDGAGKRIGASKTAGVI